MNTKFFIITVVFFVALDGFLKSLLSFSNEFTFFQSITFSLIENYNSSIFKLISFAGVIAKAIISVIALVLFLTLLFSFLNQNKTNSGLALLYLFLAASTFISFYDILLFSAPINYIYIDLLGFSFKTAIDDFFVLASIFTTLLNFKQIIKITG